MRGSSARGLVPGLAVLALIAVVAIAATGSTPTGSGDSRAPADELLDAILSISLLLLVPAAAIFVYGLLQREAIAKEIASGRVRRTSLFGFLAFFAIFTAVTAYFLNRWERPTGEAEIDESVFTGGRPQEIIPGTDATVYEPEFAWLPVLVVVALAIVGGVAAFVAMRQRAAAETRDESVSGALVDVLTDTLDDLRAEADPRRAVIAAYARFEKVLRAFGLPRRKDETPAEYLARILHDLDVAEQSVRRLTDLFAEAKFSQHEVGIGMKEEAIEALLQVRDELGSRGELERTGSPSLADRGAGRGGVAA